MPNEFIELNEVLTEVEHLPWTHGLYLPSQQKWTLQSKGAVLDPNQCEPGEDEPEFAVGNGLQRALSIHQIQGIVRNARQQKPNATPEDFLRAFLYYYDHDAFLDLSQAQ